MGLQPYWYTVPYEPDLNQALQNLRQREFKAGRYFPVTRSPEFSITPNSPAPGPRHASMEEAIIENEDAGTRSILDILRVTEEAGPFCATALPDDALVALFGTTHPDAAAVENDGFRHFRHVYAGQAICIILYKDDQPHEIFFAGYAFQ